jgi:hypothetical protein
MADMKLKQLLGRAAAAVLGQDAVQPAQRLAQRGRNFLHSEILDRTWVKRLPAGHGFRSCFPLPGACF